LVDGHRRAQALDEVDVRLVHLAEELPRVGGQRLDVPALALGEDRVEGERGLPRTGQAGEHDEAVARKLEIDAAEVVLTRAADEKLFTHPAMIRGPPAGVHVFDVTGVAPSPSAAVTRALRCAV